LVKSSAPGRLTFHRSAAEAVTDADFVQESVPERIEIKRALFAEIEPAVKPNTIVASSASGLTLSEMQDGWIDPARFVLGHPFNPPHLIPLVEVLANLSTAAGVAEQAEQFYRAPARSRYVYGVRCPVTLRTVSRLLSGGRLSI
jgi:3-hydroxybutyryl-CoA dehydrogenase